MISEMMTGDHRHCDELFADIEEAIVSADLSSAKTRLGQFLSAIQHHFAMEEEIVFPAFEQQSGMTMGPTEIMRYEHGQMRQLFTQMHEALEADQVENYLGIAETLLMMMQQHNIKEEQVLYPMTDQVLAGQQHDLLQRLRDAG